MSVQLSTSWASILGTSHCPPLAASLHSAGRVCKSCMELGFTPYQHRKQICIILCVFGYNSGRCTLGGAVVIKIAVLFISHVKDSSQ